MVYKQFEGLKYHGSNTDSILRVCTSFANQRQKKNVSGKKEEQKIKHFFVFYSKYIKTCFDSQSCLLINCFYLPRQYSIQYNV